MRGWPTFLALLLLLAIVQLAGARGDDGTWNIADRSGDQKLRYLQAPENANPTPGSTKHLDIVKVTMGGEDELGVGIDIEFDEFAVTAPRSPGMVQCFSGATHPTGRETILIDFEFTEGLPFKIEVYLVGDWDTAAVPVFRIAGAQACLCPVSPSQSLAFCPKQRVDITVDDAKDRIHVWVPKSSLIGKNPIPNPFGMPVNQDSFKFAPAVRLGDALSKLHVQTISQPLSTFLLVGAFAPYAHDVAPEDGAAPVYVFHEPAANQVIRLAFEDATTYLPVRAGANQTIGFVLTNGGDGRRIVSFNYSLAGAEEKLPAYHVYGPARATMPPMERRLFQLFLDVGPGARPEDNVTLQVRATSAGYGDVGFADAILTPGPHLGPDSPTLFLHARQSPYSSCFTNADDNNACYTAFLSPVKEDPLGVDDKRAQQYWGTTELSPQTWRGAGFAETLGQGTPSPLAFLPDGKVHLELAFEVPHRIEGIEYTASVLASNATIKDRPVATFSGTAELESPTGRIVAEEPVKAGVKTLPRGSKFRIQWEMVTSIQPGIPPSAFNSYVVPRETFARLPLMDLPPELQNRVVPSPFQLAVLGTREEFVNPGEARVVNVTILNQDVSPHTARVSALIEPEGWTAEVLPGDVFQLEPGDLIRVGILARAPPDAAEGVKATLRLNVTDEMGRPLAERFTIVAATLDLPDDSGAYRVDEDAADRLVKPIEKRTPGVGILLALAAISLALARAARRA